MTLKKHIAKFDENKFGFRENTGFTTLTFGVVLVQDFIKL
jgi:hypothetical protein